MSLQSGIDPTTHRTKSGHSATDLCPTSSDKNI